MILYKYLSSQYWESVFADNLIRFTQPSVLNDPFEMQAFYESLALDPTVKQRLTEENAANDLVSLLEDALPKVPREIAETVDMDFVRQFAHIIAPLTVQAGPFLLERITDEIGRGFYSGLDQSTGVLSLAEKNDNLLMWAHYGEQHKGIVVGFDSAHRFFDQRLSSADDFRHLRKVNYEQKRPIIRFTEEDDFSRILLTKSPEWSYEEEWRMIMPIQMADEVKKAGDETVYLFRFPPEAVKEVTLGARFCPGKRTAIHHLIRGNEAYDEAVLQDGKLDRKEFKLNFAKIP